MEQSFTQNQLIKFIYKETSLSEYLQIKEALNTDRFLFEEYEMLRRAHQQLPKVKFKPSDKTIQAVLNYSKLAEVGSEA